jgi:hypothetical protein
MKISKAIIMASASISWHRKRIMAKMAMAKGEEKRNIIENTESNQLMKAAKICQPAKYVAKIMK